MGQYRYIIHRNQPRCVTQPYPLTVQRTLDAFLPCAGRISSERWTHVQPRVEIDFCIDTYELMLIRYLAQKRGCVTSQSLLSFPTVNDLIVALEF